MVRICVGEEPDKSSTVIELSLGLTWEHEQGRRRV
ncbi:MAG: hypothetical protein QOE61_3022, partial [Micromonosporaceae bacterium]|nr:hypothetical protein [Micromonosporaceae bacterium]